MLEVQHSHRGTACATVQQKMHHYLCSVSEEVSPAPDQQRGAREFYGCSHYLQLLSQPIAQALLQVLHAIQQAPAYQAKLLKVESFIPERAGQAGAGSQSPGVGMCTCASPVGSELQLLHDILQGDQIPDVKGHWIAEGICCGICMAKWGPSSSSILLYEAVLLPDPQPVLSARLALHDMQGAGGWELYGGCRSQCQWAAHLD